MAGLKSKLNDVRSVATTKNTDSAGLITGAAKTKERYAMLARYEASSRHQLK